MSHHKLFVLTWGKKHEKGLPFLAILQNVILTLRGFL